MRKIELALAGAVVFSAAACESNQKPNTEKFTHRVSILEVDEEGEPVIGKVMRCFSDDVVVDSNESGEVVIFINDAYCPDKNLNKKYLDSSDTNFEMIRPDQMNIGLFKAEVLNQYETYIECGLPVPAPFTVSKTC